MNGCSALATANVNLDQMLPGASATADTITCVSPITTLKASSTAMNVTYAWTGPNGFVSSLQYPPATDPGTYNLTITGTNGCTSTTTLDVAIDNNIPMVTGTADTLTCAKTFVQILSNVNIPVTYKWSGPGGYTSTLQNPSVSVPGPYIVTVSASNGCSATRTITVDQNITPPSISMAGSTLSCTTPQAPVTATGPAGATYTWDNQSNAPVRLVSTPGTYSVTITGLNGCASTGSAVVLIDTVTAALQISPPQVLTCATTSVTLQTTITPGSSAVTNIGWTGPSSYTSAVKDAVVQNSGVYQLAVTTANGCTSTLQVNVDADLTKPNALAVGSTLTCSIPSNNITGSSSTTGATFAWTGPGAFVSNVAAPTVNAAGQYILTVTGPNGCTSVDTATVVLDALLPDAQSLSSNNLNCQDSTSVLTGSSATAGVTYLWNGPQGFMSPLPNPTISKPGVYVLTVAASNGCTQTSSVTVTQDLTPPSATAAGDTINCISGNAALTATSPAAGATYNWTGPGGFTSIQQNPVVSVAGLYSVVVTGLNFCTSVATAKIDTNKVSPVVSLAGAGTLTCSKQALTLTGTINTPNSTGVWSGPAGFTPVTTDTAVVTMAGDYTFTVTSGDNGCISKPKLTVAIDTLRPKNTTAFGGLLSCVVPSLTIHGNSTTSGATYSWTGPNGFTSNLKNPTGIIVPGNYIVTITNPANGCTKSATAIVTKDIAIPVVASTTDSITCLKDSVILLTTSSIAAVSYKWSGPNGFASALQNPTVGDAGLYQVEVTVGASGCKKDTSILVKKNVVPPGASATGDTLTCTAQSGQIKSQSPTAGVSYIWTGPGGFTSTVSSPTVTLAGTYTVTITSPSNGCISTAESVVTPDVNAPVVNATGGTITCAAASIPLNATSSINTVTWSWTGPGSFTSTQASPTATVAGNYSVTAKAPNGCTTTETVQVLADTLGPVTSVGTPKQLNCTTTQVPLSVTVQGLGNYNYLWTTQTGNILTSPGANVPNPQVTAAGLYTVVVTNSQNGCKTTKNVTVTVDVSTPFATFHKRNVNCYGDTNGSISLDSVSGGTPPYLYSLDNGPFSAASVFTSLAPKSYKIVVQDAKGCEYQTSLAVGEPDLLTVNLGPDTTIFLGDSIQLSLSGTTNHPENIKTYNVDPKWLFPGTNLDTTYTEFLKYTVRYTVTAVDSNGCKATDQRLIIVDKHRHVFIPNIFNPDDSSINGQFQIFCGNDVEMIKSFQIFDRWGNLISEHFKFLPNSANATWDGKVKGQKANPAVFVYYAEILFKDGETELYKGDVTIEY
jgi:hypothetical protein